MINGSFNPLLFCLKPLIDINPTSFGLQNLEPCWPNSKLRSLNYRILKSKIPAIPAIQLKQAQNLMSYWMILAPRT